MIDMERDVSPVLNNDDSYTLCGEFFLFFCMPSRVDFPLTLAEMNNFRY